MVNEVNFAGLELFINNFVLLESSNPYDTVEAIR